MSTGAPGRSSGGRSRVAVVGAGAWGTTLAMLADRAGSAATLVVRDRSQAELMVQTRRHPRSLAGVTIGADVSITFDADAGLVDADIVVLAVPVYALGDVARSLAPLLVRKIVVSAAKGLEQDSLRRPTEVIDAELMPSPENVVCALSGPNLAREIASGQPATTVVAAADPSVAGTVQRALMSPRFRVYTSGDVIGVEIGGALKNVIAIGAGIGDEFNAGDNAKAAFLTRGIAEIARLGIACGAEPLTFAGLSGIGDLVATCASPLSRNNRVGRELARGRPLAEILESLGEVAEGVPTARAGKALGTRLAVELPITEAIHDILFLGISPHDALRRLMEREPKHELGGVNR